MTSKDGLSAPFNLGFDCKMSGLCLFFFSFFPFLNFNKDGATYLPFLLLIANIKSHFAVVNNQSSVMN